MRRSPRRPTRSDVARSLATDVTGAAPPAGEIRRLASLAAAAPPPRPSAAWWRRWTAAAVFGGALAGGIGASYATGVVDPPWPPADEDPIFPTPGVPSTPPADPSGSTGYPPAGHPEDVHPDPEDRGPREDPEPVGPTTPPDQAGPQQPGDQSSTDGHGRRDHPPTNPGHAGTPPSAVPPGPPDTTPGHGTGRGKGHGPGGRPDKPGSGAPGPSTDPGANKPHRSTADGADAPRADPPRGKTRRDVTPARPGDISP